jgi:1-acyl-sn-glycerol-3-phosphate acyltransferase
MRGPSRARAWRRLLGVVLLLMLCLPLHGLWRLFGARSPWPARFLGAAARAAGCRRPTIAGTPLGGTVLLVANHVSWLDILLLAGVTATRFVAKDEVRGWPLIGWLAGLNRTVYVARARRGEVMAQADAVRAALGEDQPVTLFAEGTTGDGRTLLPFRASLFAAVMPPPAGVRVQPVAIDYGAEAPAIAWVGDSSAATDAMRVLALPGRRRATLQFGPPIDPAAFSDRKAIAAATQAEVARMLGGSAPSGV